MEEWKNGRMEEWKNGRIYPGHGDHSMWERCSHTLSSPFGADTTATATTTMRVNLRPGDDEYTQCGFDKPMKRFHGGRPSASPRLAAARTRQILNKSPDY